MRRRIGSGGAALAAAALVLLALSGCGILAPGRGGWMGDGGGSPYRTVDVARADVMFTAMMIPHHEEAVEMSRLMLAKQDIDPAIDDLAQRIENAQIPEIERMERWLDDWGFGGMSDMPGMGRGGGMMSGSDLDRLDAARGLEAERYFLTEMIDHHEVAIDMSESEVRNGRYAPVVDLAGDIIRSQTAEIAEMRELLRER